jgi:hypothetical protein
MIAAVAGPGHSVQQWLGCNDARSTRVGQSST